MVAGFLADGLSREAVIVALADEGFEVKDTDTITRWRRDPRVKPLVEQLISDRAVQVSRRVDAVIEGRLANAETMDTETLLKIRKEYGGATVGRKEVGDDTVTADAIRAMESDPNFADNLRRVLSGEAPLPSDPSGDEEPVEAA